MRRILKSAAVAVPIVTVCGAVALDGCKAKTPWALETRAMTIVKHQVLIGNRSQKNPIAASAASIADGKEALVN